MSVPRLTPIANKKVEHDESVISAVGRNVVFSACCNSKISRGACPEQRTEINGGGKNRFLAALEMISEIHPRVEGLKMTCCWGGFTRPSIFRNSN